LNGTHELLICADDVTVGQKCKCEERQVLLQASREADLELNSEKTKYMFMSHHHSAGQTLNINAANEPSKRWQFIYLEMTVTNENYIHDEI